MSEVQENAKKKTREREKKNKMLYSLFVIYWHYLDFHFETCERIAFQWPRPREIDKFFSEFFHCNKKQHDRYHFKAKHECVTANVMFCLSLFMLFECVNENKQHFFFFCFSAQSSLFFAVSLSVFEPFYFR